MKGFDTVERKLLAFLRRGIDDDRWPGGWLLADADDVLQRVASACAANGVKLWTEIEATRDRIVERFREMGIFDEPVELSRDVATLHKNRDAETAARLADCWQRLATHPVVARPGTPPLEALQRFHHVSAGRLDAAMNPKAGDRITQRELIALALWQWHVDSGETVPLTTAILMETVTGCKEPAVAKSLAAFFGQPGRANYVEAVDDADYLRRMLAKHVPDRYRRDEAAFGEQWSDDLGDDDEGASGKPLAGDHFAETLSKFPKERNRRRKICAKI